MQYTFEEYVFRECGVEGQLIFVVGFSVFLFFFKGRAVVFQMKWFEQRLKNEILCLVLSLRPLSTL